MKRKRGASGGLHFGVDAGNRRAALNSSKAADRIDRGAAVVESPATFARARDVRNRRRAFVRDFGDHPASNEARGGAADRPGRRRIGLVRVDPEKRLIPQEAASQLSQSSFMD
ncbi:MAG: hypothetical protein AAGF90_11865 [Pseudomonadota bacterium]